MSYGVIYKITNQVNQKCYIGQTINSIEERFQRHISDSKNPERSFCLQRAIAKHGAENFKIETIFECSSQEELDTQERSFVDMYNAWSPNGYNLQAGRGRGSVSLETRVKLSEAHKGLLSGDKNPMFGRTGDKHPLFGRRGELSPFFGRRDTEESKKRKSLALKGKYIGEQSSFFGKTHSDETKKVMSENHSGEKNPFFGKKHSDDLVAAKSKTYYFISPEGEKIVITNLRNFCRENPHLHRSALLRVNKGTQDNHKGWRKAQ